VPWLAPKDRSASSHPFPLVSMRQTPRVSGMPLLMACWSSCLNTTVAASVVRGPGERKAVAQVSSKVEMRASVITGS
jgi:hypothetical protein